MMKWSDFGCVALYCHLSGEVIGQIVMNPSGWTCWARPTAGRKMNELIIIGAHDSKDAAKTIVEQYYKGAK